MGKVKEMIDVGQVRFISNMCVCLARAIGEHDTWCIGAAVALPDYDTQNAHCQHPWFVQ